MTRLTLLLLPAALLAAPAAVHAQDWNDDGRVRGFERAPRVYWDGPCRVTQRINADGELVERRRCRGDRDAELRASRPDDDAPRRYADDEPPRYYGRRGDDDREPEPRYAPDPAPLPVYQAPAVQPVLRAPRIIAQGVPVAAPRPAVKAAAAPRPAVKAAAAPRVAAKAAPALRAALKPAPASKAAAQPVAAPRVLARIAPPKPVRVAAAVKPVAKPAPVRVAIKAAPIPKRAEPMLTARAEPKPAARAAAKAQPAARAVRAVAKVAPPAKPVMRPARVVARLAPLPKRPPAAPPAAPPVKVIAKAAPPAPKSVVAPVRMVAKAAPPAVVAKAELPLPKPAARPPSKSDWLVLLPPDEAKAEPEATPVPDAEKSAPLVQARVYAKGESYLQSRAYREYGLRKRSDPYSNLR